MSDRLSKELRSFDDIWEGGYYEGNPLDSISRSTFGQLGFMSVLYATYLRCIKPYITDDTIALEIGPGRGAWTETMLPSKEVWTLDARSAEENCFFEYLGNPENVKYFQVENFKCEMLPENTFDYVFSFGCLCHVSFAGITEYAVNLYPKMKRGSNCFWMIADHDKYNHVVRDLEKYSIWKALVPKTPKFFPLRSLFTFLMKWEKRRTPNQHPVMSDKDQDPRRVRWRHAGVERTCSMLQETGYEIVDPDVGTIIRDPIIHFRKP